MATNPKKADRSSYYRRTSEEFLFFVHRILDYVHRGITRVDFQKEVSSMILDFSGCDAVELWVKEHNKYFRCRKERHGDPSHPFEITTLELNEDGELISGPKDDPGLISVCRKIIRDRAGSGQPRYMRDGKFWTATKKKTKTSRIKSPKASSVRGIYLDGPYRSSVILPLIGDHRNIGLLQLLSKKRNYFLEDEFRHYVSLAQSLGIALAHRRAQVDLRERVKELACLYGIARIVAQPGINLDNILQGIAEILPSAWLYPEIASARITLDGRLFSTSVFVKERHRQTADIIIEGRKRGQVEMVYGEERPELDEGPFLREERDLIDAVAKEIAGIVERKKVEDHQLRLQKQLIRSEKMAALGQLSAGIAHEIRTPLTSIKIFIQSLEKEIDLDENQSEDFRIIKREIDRINENVTRFLNFARPEEPQFQQVNVNALLADTLNLLAAKIKSSGIGLDAPLREDLPPVEGDPKQLSQVFLNLVLNAVEAMPEGGTLSIGSSLKMNPDIQEKVIQIVFQDTGYGISEKDRPYLFDPFFTTKEKGTGLGLSIVYSIIQKHNGQIEVKSELGKGSLFIISLPVSKEKSWKESSSSMTT